MAHHQAPVHGEPRVSKRRLLDESLTQNDFDKALRTISALQAENTTLKRQLAAQKGLVTKAINFSAPRVVWECRVDSGYWVQFDEHISSLLDDAAADQVLHVRFERKGIPYEVNLNRMIQRRRCGAYDTERDVRRRTVNPLPASEHASLPRSSQDEVWHTAPHSTPQQSNGLTMRSLPIAMGASFTVSRDTREVNFALGHFVRSCGGQSGERRVLRVDIYENPAQRTRFEHARSALEAKGAPTNEIWVWHGSRSNGSISAIMSDGFKVGGKDAGIPVAHGMVHGPGVNTSRTVPFGYTTTTQKVILSRALPGNHRVVNGSHTGEDSWMPMGSQDWIIFRDGGQLLPLYVIHFS